MKTIYRWSVAFLFVIVIGGLAPEIPSSLHHTVEAQTNDPVLVGAGDIANCRRSEDEATAKLLDNISGTVFTLGDNAYQDGTQAQFSDCYGPTWGRHKDRTRPSAGNHDYHVTGAAGYYAYFGSAASPLDTNCTSNCKGYYSYNLGSWHIIVLNSEIAHETGSAQEQWLRADLAANSSSCTLAYWHKPRFSSGLHGNRADLHPFWQALYDYQADVVLSGHDHTYERFALQNPNGQADPNRGIRQFVVGTGGASLYPFPAIQPNSQVRNNNTWGVLELTLHEASYDWRFVPIAGQTFTDSGSANCVGASVTPTATPAPSQTPTSTPSPTPTPMPSPTSEITNSTYHIGDIDGASNQTGNTWTASVTFSVHTYDHILVSNATVQGDWSNGASGPASCTTDRNGRCRVEKSGILSWNTSVTFTVNNITHVALGYSSEMNHDPDGDSDGTRITMVKPGAN